jgi:uridine phosphorylase
MLHHLGEVTSAAITAVLTGDPDRVPALAEAAGMTRATWTNRGYVCVEVDIDGEPGLVCSTGIGGPSMAIVVEELGQLGVRQLIRIGTCGSMQKHVRADDLVISTGSVRDDGASHAYLPAEFPAVPDFALTAAFVHAARNDETAVHIGVTHCKDAYYTERPGGFPLADHWRDRWAKLKEAGVLATEMEAAPLFAVATVRHMRAAAAFVPVDSTTTKRRTLAALCAATQAAFRAGRAVSDSSDQLSGEAKCAH